MVMLIIRLVCRFSEKKFISSMMIIVLVSICMNLLIDFFIVCGWLEILCSCMLVGSVFCRCLNLVLSVLLSLRMLLLFFIVIVRLIVFLFMKCILGDVGLVKLCLILVMLFRCSVWLLVWIGNWWMFLMLLNCLVMCSCMWLVGVLKKLVLVIVFWLVSVCCICCSDMFSVVSLVLDSLIQIFLFCRLIRLILFMFGICCSFSWMWLV